MTEENNQHQATDATEGLNDQLLVRREKMAELKESGYNPFASGFERNAVAADLHKKYEAY